MQTTTMFSASLPRLVVALLAVTLAIGALGVSGGVGPHGMAVAADSDDGGNVSAGSGDEDSTIIRTPDGGEVDMLPVSLPGIDEL